MLTKQDIFDLVEEEDVRFIRLQFTDMLGTIRNLAIRTSRLEDALDNLCMFDGSSIIIILYTPMSDFCTPISLGRICARIKKNA